MMHDIDAASERKYAALHAVGAIETRRAMVKKGKPMHTAKLPKGSVCEGTTIRWREVWSPLPASWERLAGFVGHLAAYWSKHRM